MQVSRLASCLFLQAQSSSPTSAPAAICSISTHFFRVTPLFSLKRLAFFKSRPQECYFCPLNNPSQISETARTAGRCDRRGMRTTPRLCPAFSPLSRRGVQNLSILPVSACSRICRKRQVSSIPLHLLFRPNPLRLASVELFCRTLARRPVFGFPVGTRSTVS